MAERRNHFQKEEDGFGFGCDFSVVGYETEPNAAVAVAVAAGVVVDMGFAIVVVVVAGVSEN